MPRFQGEAKETFLLDGPLEKVRDHFSDVHTIARSTGEMESSTILDPHTIHFVVKPQNSHGVTFRGDYICRYEVDPSGVLRWRSTTSNHIWVSGDARFTALSPQKTQVEYHQVLEMEMDVNRILAKLISPLVAKGIRDGVKQYLRAMKDGLRSTS